MNPWRALRGLPRQLWILAAASLINRAGTMVLPFLALYFTRSLGFSAERAGGILAIYGVTALVVSPVAGRLADRIGALLVMRVSLVASATAMLAFPFVSSFPAVVAATLLLGVTGEMYRPAIFTFLSEIATPEQRKQAFALNRLAVNLGMSVGPAVGGMLAAISFRALFFVDGATSLAAAVVMFTALRAPERPAALPATSGASVPARSVLGALADLRFLYFAAALLPIGIVFFQLQAALPLYIVRDVGLSEAAFGAVLTVNTIIIVLIEVPLNAAMASWPYRRALSLGAALFALGFGANALVTGPRSLAATVVIWSFGEMIFFPGSAAYVADLAPPDRRGEYMGLYSMAFAVCFAIGPWIGTLILERWGSLTLWVSMLLVGSVSTLMMTRLARTPTEIAQAEARAQTPG